MSARRIRESPLDWVDAGQIKERADRLKVAVKHAGGPGMVSWKARMPSATLSNYMAGRDMKASALVTLAQTCGVSLLWLASGHGGMLDTSGQVDLRPIVEILKGDGGTDPVSFHLLVTLITTCRDFYRKNNVHPTLEMMLSFVSPSYHMTHHSWTDRRFKIADVSQTNDPSQPGS